MPESPNDAVADQAGGDPGPWRQQLHDPDPIRRGRAAEALGAAGDTQSVPVLRELLRDRDGVVAFKAAQALAFLGDAGGVSVLVWALRTPDLCFASLQALTEVAAPEAREPLQRFFSRPFLHPLERMQAAAALHRLGVEPATRYLCSCLESTRPEVRGFALELWGRMRMPEALERLVRILEDPTDPHRLDAVRGLGQLGDPRALPALRRVAASGEDPELSELARAAADGMREEGT
jgi:HEAT repeat protein